MINIPVHIGATLLENGIEVIAWSGDTESEPDHLCWSDLVDDLVEAYTIPNKHGDLLFSRKDYDYLVEVLQGLQGAASKLHCRLNEAEVT